MRFANRAVRKQIIAFERINEEKGWTLPDAETAQTDDDEHLYRGIGVGV